MTATFRPPARYAPGFVLLGAMGGLAIGFLLDIPPLAAGLMGAVAAAITAFARWIASPRIVADERGLRLAPGQFDARWEEVELRFAISPRLGEDGEEDEAPPQRCAFVTGPRGQALAFAEMLGLPPPAPLRGPGGREVEVLDLRDAALLLGIVAQRTGHFLFPEAVELAAVECSAPSRSVGPAPLPVAAGAPEPEPRREKGGARVGLVGLLLKLGGKLGAGALKAASLLKVGWFAASFAAYGFLFSWKFALAIMAQLFVHEYGHVHAMKKTGMRVKGMYFVPFLGALAVTDESFKSRRQQAYVALWGPVWGSIAALVPAGVYLYTRNPVWAAVASWWAIVNLFNMLPIAPLDGGRIMQALAASFSSAAGLAVSFLGLGAAVALGMVLDFSLIYFVAALGALELMGELSARAGARGLALLAEPARYKEAHWLYLRACLGLPSRGADAMLLRRLESHERALRCPPMKAWEVALWGLGYLALAVGLVLLVHWLRLVPGADAAAKLLS